MSKEEKLITMELLWSDLSKDSSRLKSPDWHENILKKREKDIESGNSDFDDWDNAKKEIWKMVQ